MKKILILHFGSISSNTNSTKWFNNHLVTVTYKESDLLLGDADGNGEVNNADAVAVLRHLVDNTPSNFVPENADVNQDGRIDNADAVLILRMLVE